jgi:integrase
MNATQKRNARRRQRNTGSMRLIATGKWQLRYKGESDVILAATKTAASEALQVFVERVRNGGIAVGDRMTFDELADLFLESKSRSKAPTSLAWYKRNLKQHIRPALGAMKLRDLRAVHVQRMLDGAKDKSRTKRKGEGLGASTLRNLLVLVRAVLAWGVKQGMLRENIASKVDPPREEHIERPTLTPTDAANVLRAAQGTDLFAVIATAIATGARRSELCALRWTDLDLDEGTIAIRRRAANVDKRVVIGETKTKNSRRTDHLPSFLVTLLREHRQTQLTRFESLFGELAARRRQRDGYVFTTPLGELWDPNELSRQFTRFIRRHGLPHFRFHDLRHGYASLAFAAGVPLAVVSKSLGHAGIGITANVYTHLLTDQKREKAAVIDRYLGDALSTAIGGKRRA